MIRLRKVYRQKIPLEKEEIISLLKNSSNFIREDEPSYGGQLYTSTLMNKIVYKELPNNEIQLSENAGFGMSELIGELTITNKKFKKSIVIIKFQMGVFPIITPYILIAVFTTLGLFSLLIDAVLTLLFCLPLLISLALLFAKQNRVRLFLERIQNALHISNNWTN